MATVFVPHEARIKAYALFVSFFFFQAEDGIRDHCVTGVQTCALPISMGNARRRRWMTRRSRKRRRPTRSASTCRSSSRSPERSEERRVGKACRSRWSTYQSHNDAKEESRKTALTAGDSRYVTTAWLAV